MLDRLESSGSVRYHGRRLSESDIVFGVGVKRSSFKIGLNGLGLQSRKLSMELPSREEPSNLSNECWQLLREAWVPPCGFCEVSQLLQHEVIEC